MADPCHYRRFPVLSGERGLNHLSLLVSGGTGREAVEVNDFEVLWLIGAMGAMARRGI